MASYGWGSRVGEGLEWRGGGWRVEGGGWWVPGLVTVRFPTLCAPTHLARQVTAVRVLGALGDDPLAAHARFEDVAVATVAQRQGVGRKIDRGGGRVPPAELLLVPVLAGERGRQGRPAGSSREVRRREGDGNGQAQRWTCHGDSRPRAAENLHNEVFR